jgi:RimJ/RimL family protein N-acetyltransferase
LGVVPADAGRDAQARPSASPSPVLREMKPGDGAAFRGWDMRMSEMMPYALKLPSEVPAAEAIERDITHVSSDPRYWLVAAMPRPRGGEAIIGFASANIEYGFRMQHDAFLNVAVLPEWQGQGLGRRLHERAEAWAIDRGVRRLTATVQAPNLAGRAFAAALGYEPEVTMRGYSFIGGYMVDRLRLGKLFGG